MILSNFRTLYDWFCENFMTFNPGKCHFVFIGMDTHDEDVFYYDNLTLKNINVEEILVVTIDRKLTFHQYIKKCIVKQVKN